MKASILDQLPEVKLGEHFHEFFQRPTKELYAQFRLMQVAEFWELSINTNIMSRKKSQLAQIVAERHLAFCSWYRNSTEAVNRLRPNHYAALASLDQIPPLYLGKVEEIRQVSVNVPPAHRGDKDLFTFGILKLFLCAVEDNYNGEYLIGRSDQVDAPNVLISKTLQSNHLAFFYIRMEAEGNLIILHVSYMGRDSRIAQNEDVLAWPNQSWTRGQLSRERFEALCRETDQVNARANKIIQAPISISLDASTNAFFCQILLLAPIGMAVVFLINSGFDTWTRQCSVAVGACGLGIFLILIIEILKNRKNKRAESSVLEQSVNNSLRLSPSPFFYHKWWYSDWMQVKEHQIFAERMMQSLDLAIRNLEKTD